VFPQVGHDLVLFEVLRLPHLSVNRCRHGVNWDE
jgi:hypothetical protein